MKDQLIIVAGAGGFIGGHLVGDLIRQGRRVRAVDIKPPREWFQRFKQAENLQLDLSSRDACDRALKGARGGSLYNFACDMGGMGFIEHNKATCMVSVLINTNLLLAAKEAALARYFFASSVCIYNTELQKDLSRPPLKEPEAYPALPDDGYGWEKLFGERLCRHFREDLGLQTRVARYQPVYGPAGTWEGGRERVPAAICRKVAQARLTGKHEIEIWGDGTQTRSFMFVDDCIRGTQMLLNSDLGEPVNIGPRELTTINELVSLVEEIGGITLQRRYKLDAPIGVGGRRADNSLLRTHLEWEPSTSLRSGLEATYAWVYDQYAAKYGPSAAKLVSAGTSKAPRRPKKAAKPAAKKAGKKRVVRRPVR